MLRTKQEYYCLSFFSLTVKVLLFLVVSVQYSPHFDIALFWFVFMFVTLTLTAVLSQAPVIQCSL